MSAAAAAAAKSLQSCPTLCDPIDGSPPGSPVSGIKYIHNVLQPSPLSTFITLFCTQETETPYFHLPPASGSLVRLSALNLPMLSERAMAPRSSALAWKIPWTEEPGRLQSIGPLGVGYN